jgi:DNA adenine methylase
MMTEEEHAELLGVIKQIPARVIISGYWSPLYAETLKGWRTVSFTSVKRSGEKATE